MMIVVVMTLVQVQIKWLVHGDVLFSTAFRTTFSVSFNG
ncbi:hypothetical protein KPSA1_04367 [Pseudomonas syringae pv. actinidiae]|uniref:Uncharacterized protein n=1 Tax=Pseudomonas syringae pv. actinidiae TaxID=103796 RepID=A0A2V0QJV9_PSESF|nr:hypothetical protein KPSA1_04367 [Pseudomonas syringae pv. actinidiae]